jgi:hypothetical protein
MLVDLLHRQSLSKGSHPLAQLEDVLDNYATCVVVQPDRGW